MPNELWFTIAFYLAIAVFFGPMAALYTWLIIVLINTTVFSIWYGRAKRKRPYRGKVRYLRQV